MNNKEAALITYLEFNLIALVDQIRPHLKDDVNEEEIYGYANNVLDEMRDCLTQPTGLTTTPE